MIFNNLNIKNVVIIMNKYLFVKSGIGNQLIPLISLLRMCDKYDYKLNVIFNKIVAYNFTQVNSKSLSIPDLIEIDYSYNILSGFPTHCVEKNCEWSAEYNTIRSNEENDIFYFNVCHLFGDEDDNVKLYSPFPCKKIIENLFFFDLKKYVKLIKPVKLIKEKIDIYVDKLNKIDNKVLGLHVRTLDGGFIEMYNEDNLFNYIDNFLEKNKNWKIYISTDNKNTEDKLINKYNDFMLKLDNPFGNNYDDKFSDNNYGLMNSMYEIFILSKCDKFVGSAGSSFSLLAWLLSNNNILEFWNEQ